MARIVTPLTNTQIKQAKPKDKIYKLSDGEGLQLRIKPNGSKSWLLDYFKPYTKKRTSISLGKYPDVSLSEARDKKRLARELLAKDIDPKAHKDEQQLVKKREKCNTLRLVAQEWFEVKKTKVTPQYAVNVWSSLELHIFPDLGNCPISEISAPITINTLKPVASKGSLETIKRVCQRLNEIMTFAVNTGLIHANPLSGISAAFEKPKKQHLPTITPEELPNLMSAINIASIKLVTRCLIEWQLHTMTRPNEAATAKWCDIDFEDKLWNIPAEQMKTNRAHSIPLTTQSLALLEFLKPISGHRTYVFPADRNPRTHANLQTANAALKRMGFKDKLVAHGMRALASTTLNEQGFDPDVIEAALAHIDKNEVRAAYNRAKYIERRREMMNWWSDKIEISSSGKLPTLVGN